MVGIDERQKIRNNLIRRGWISWGKGGQLEIGHNTLKSQNREGGVGIDGGQKVSNNLIGKGWNQRGRDWKEVFSAAAAAH